jgi:hypothetical protein
VSSRNAADAVYVGDRSTDVVARFASAILESNAARLAAGGRRVRVNRDLARPFCLATDARLLRDLADPGLYVHVPDHHILVRFLQSLGDD